MTNSTPAHTLDQRVGPSPVPGICPRCGAELHSIRRGLRSVGYAPTCVACGFVREPGQQPRRAVRQPHIAASGPKTPPPILRWQWATTALGTLFILVCGTAAIAIPTVRDMTCSTGNRTYSCDYDRPLDIWFDTPAAERVGWWAVCIAGLVVPFLVGLVVRRWEWLALPPIAVGVAAFLGDFVGTYIAEQRYPDLYFTDPWSGLLVIVALFIGIPASEIAAFCGVLLGKALRLYGAGKSAPSLELNRTSNG